MGSLAGECADLDPLHIKQELLAAPRPLDGRPSHIGAFYANRSVLITGASGFIGKVLIEKLLRTCPAIVRIFVIIRPKWNKRPDERLRELLEAPLFDGVRDQRLAERVVLVEGDVTQPNLGLSGKNLSTIIEQVSVVFHSAATVKFDEPLKQSVGINISGTKNMIEICRRIPQLAALVHVSTAYANCDQDEIEEHIYRVDMDPEKLVQMADWLDQDTLQELKARLLGARPNTYTYTKALAEWLLVRSARDLPVVVCRPSIVVASHQEPFKGWIDNVNGPTGVILGAGKGLVRSMFAQEACVADLVPVDTVISLVVALGWFAYINKGHKQLSDAAAGSFTESIISGRSTSPLGSAGSSSGDELADEIEPQRAGHKALNFGHGKSTSANEQHDLSPEQQQRPQQQLQQQQLQQRKQTSRQQIDDGYGSLNCSDYSSAVSSSDTASNASSSTSSLTRHRNHHLSHHHHRRCLARTQTVSEHKHTTLGHSGEPIDETIQDKLRNFRLRARAKLSDRQLPEELADVPVFHCTSGSENPITWGQIRILILTALAMYPSIKTYRYPSGSFTANKTLDDFYRLTLHYIPAYIVDFITRLFGGKPIIVKIFNKFDQAAGVLKTFTSRQWKFHHDNRLFLFNELMTEEDRRLFNFDIRSLDWNEFLYSYVLGTRKFLLKEPMENLEQARSNLKTTYYRNLSLQIIFTATFAYIFVSNCCSSLF